MRRVVMFSGGVGSWAAAKRVAERYGTHDLVLLFTDTKAEDPDLYRFLDQATLNVGGDLVRIADGRTPWQVFWAHHIIGNSRMAPCSRELKQWVANRWLSEHCEPGDTTIYTGVDWTEEHRHIRLRDRRAGEGWRYEAPMCEAPYLTKAMMFELLRDHGIELPYLYRLGFEHNNCSACCVRAGIGHWVRLLWSLPDRYAEQEAREREFREHFGREVAILRDRTGGKARPMTLRELRGRVQAGEQMDMFDIGGCGCFVDVAAA